MHGTYEAVPVREFRGRYTQSNPQGAPPGFSPLEQNVDFQPGRVFSRPGTTTLLSLSGGVISMKEFATLDPTVRYVMATTGAGVLWRIASDSTLTATQVESYLGTASRMKSETIFGRHWMAFSADGLTGSEIPRKYDGVTISPIGNCSPGRTPDVHDSVVVGSITAGVHQMRCVFRFESGYLSPPSDPAEWTAAGGLKADVGGTIQIPIGPPGCTGRILTFTRANDKRAFFMPGTAMDVKDNTTTAVAGINFTDEELGAAVSIEEDDQDLMNLVPLPPCAGIGAFSSRLVAWNVLNSEERVGDVGFYAMSFNGGFNSDFPDGWAAPIVGGGPAPAKSNPAGATGDCYRIIGDGVTGRVGEAQNRFAAYQVIKPGIAYRVRLRMQKGAGTTGQFLIFLLDQNDLSWPNGPPGPLVAVDASDVSDTDWTWIDSQIMSPAENVPGQEWVLRLAGGAVGNVVSNGGYFDIDQIYFYEGAQPVFRSRAYWSKGGRGEAFDFVTGAQDVAENDGQGIVTGFRLRNNWYYVKDHSIHKTSDTGEEPALWPVEEVSSKVGTPSVNGVATADGWAIIASQSGIYFFAGGWPIPIDEGIRTEWTDSIDWSLGYLITVAIDTDSKRILISVPYKGSTVNNKTYMLKYRGASPLEWLDTSRWTILSFSTEVVRRGAGTTGQNEIWFAAGTQIRLLDPTVYYDNGTAINTLYSVGYLGADASRVLIGALRANVAGVGSMSPQAVRPDGASGAGVGGATNLPARALSVNPPGDLEWPRLHLLAERIQFIFSDDGVTTNRHWDLRKLVFYVKPAPHGGIRGTTSIPAAGG